MFLVVYHQCERKLNHKISSEIIISKEKMIKYWKNLPTFLSQLFAGGGAKLCPLIIVYSLSIFYCNMFEKNLFWKFSAFEEVPISRSFNANNNIYVQKEQCMDLHFARFCWNSRNSDDLLSCKGQNYYF